MALTAAQQTDAYRFFSIAFDAAPGITYMNQLADAYGAGMTTKQIVNVFTTKEQFTSKYPSFLTNQTFATNLINNVVGTSATDAAKAEAVADVVAAINGGMTRGDVIYQIFTNLAGKPATDEKWSGTAKLMANKVAVAQYYTETLMGNTTSLTTLQTVLAGVTSAADVSTPAAIQALLGDVFNAQGQSFTLTANADQVPGLLGSAATVSTSGNDVYVATNTTLSSADRLVDSAGADKLKYSSQAASTHAAFEMKGIETLEVTADQGNAVSFDLSGSEGLTVVKTLNSTGSVTYSQITTLADIEVNNVTNATNGASVTVAYQDSIVAGTADDVDLTLANNSNVTPVGIITVGSTSVPNGGVETISAIVSGSNATVTRLDSNISTLNVSGDKNLTINNALNSTVDKVVAGTFTGALNINLTGNVAAAGETALSITTGTGNDVIDLLSGSGLGTAPEVGTTPDLPGNSTVTRAATISTGAGNDVVQAGLGADNIDLGAGDDTLVLTVGGLTVADQITGGDGTDQITLNTNDSINTSEAERVTKVEKINLLGSGTYFEVTNNLVNTADGGMFTINTNNSDGAATNPAQLTTGGHTIDLTNLAFSSTGKFTLTGQGRVAGAATVVPQNGTQDTVIADDATVNAKATLTFGQDGVVTGTPANTYAGDTLRIMDGGDYRFDDFANVTGLDVIEIRGTNQVAQTYNLELVTGMIDNYDSATGTVGDANDDLVIKVDRNVPQGSVVNINASQITATQRVTVYSNSNVTVNVTGDTAGRVTVLSSLEFTENSDNLVGTTGDDLFTADSLDQVDTADLATGNAQVTADTLQLNFAVHNSAQNLIGAQLNGVGITGIERITFNTNSPVGFTDDTTAANSTTGVILFTTGSGNDNINGSINALNNSYNMGAGNNTWTSFTTDSNNAVTTTGSGTNTINFVAVAAAGTTLTAGDSVSTGTTGNGDTLNITDGAGAGAVFALPNVITGVDFITYTTGHVGDGLLLDGPDVNTADDGETNFTVTDASAADNTVAIVDASALTAGNANPFTLNVSVVAGAAGNLGLATNAADVIGGADADTLTLGATLGGAGGGYVVRGNAGADTISIGANATGVIVNINTANDGGAQGQATGFDVVTGFTSGTDVIGFTDNLIESVFQTTVARVAVGANTKAGNAALAGGAGAAGSLLAVTDAAVNFNNAQDALVITQIGGGVTDAQLTDLLTIAQKANVLGVTAAATDGGIVVVQGATKSAVYLYVEQDGTANNVATSELKILGTFDAAVVATDLWVI